MQDAIRFHIGITILQKFQQVYFKVILIVVFL